MSSTKQPFTIPGYRLMRRLGVGGMATVWLAQQESLSRLVAIKVLAGERAPSDELVRRFENEARTIARLDHPHIVQIHDVGRTSTGQIYYTMPHLPKGDLAGRNLRDDPERVLAIVRALAEALGCAHDHGIVHRDVKPENVLFDTQDRPMLADFGIALTGSQHPRVTSEGTTIGSSGYMSPEQARGQPIDGRSDIYSLGVLTYELLTGEMPFQGQDALAVALAHIEKPVPRLPVTRRIWQPLIDRALAKDPDQRFQSAEELIAATDVIARRMHRVSSHRFARGWRGAVERIVAVPRRLRALMIAAALFVLVLVMLVLAAPRRDGSSSIEATPAGAMTGTVAAPAVTPPADPVADARARRLRDAESAMAGNRLAGDDGAIAAYLAVLGAEPHQPDAVAGIGRILDRLATDAATAIVADDAAAATIAIEQAQDLATRASGDAAAPRAAFGATVEAAIGQRLAKPLDDRAAVSLATLLPSLEQIAPAAARALAQRLETPRPTAPVAAPGRPAATKTEHAVDTAPVDVGGPALVLLPAAKESPMRLAIAVDETTVGDYATFARETHRGAARCRASQGLLARLRRGDIDWRNPGFAQDDAHPVVCVSWNDAMAYAAWLTRRTGARYRLPSSNEWLLAARQDSGAAGCRGANLDSHANGCNDGFEFTAPAGRFARGRSGTDDIAGNVSEWVDVCAKPGREPRACPVHRFRGLSWLDDDGESNLDHMDTAGADVGFANVGFRLVREIPASEPPR